LMRLSRKNNNATNAELRMKKKTAHQITLAALSDQTTR